MGSLKSSIYANKMFDRKKTNMVFYHLLGDPEISSFPRGLQLFLGLCTKHSPNEGLDRVHFDYDC